MKRLLQRGYWWAVRRLYPVHQVGRIEFIDLRAERAPPTAELVHILRDALERIRAAGEDCLELVEGHLRLVGAMGFTRGSVWTGVNGYMTAFSEDERNAHYLACRLVWAAAFLKLVAGQRQQAGHQIAAAAREGARAAQLDFVRRFPESEKWAQYVLKHGP